jgi:hypothetical protein
LCQLIVEVITVEKLLDWVSSQVTNVLFEFRIIKIFPLFIDVLLIKIILKRRNEWWLQFLIVKIIPRKVTQPWVVFHFFWSIVTKTILRLALNHFIDEVGSFNCPTARNFSLLYLNLLWENMVSDFLTALAYIRSSAVHALVGHHAYSKVIDTGCMVLSAHDFRCHIAWRSRGILSIFRPPNSCNSEVCDPQVTFFIDYQVFRLDISMDNVLFVAAVETCNQTRHKKSYY